MRQFAKISGRSAYRVGRGGETPYSRAGIVKLAELWRYVRQIKAPIIYILGERSSIVPHETQQQLRRELPRAQIITMPGLGHYPSDEDPAGFLTIVRQFLSGQKIDNSTQRLTRIKHQIGFARREVV